MQHSYTAEQLAWLRRWYPRFAQPLLTRLFNRRFNARVTDGAIKALLARHKITCGRTGRFEKNRIPYNKDMKGLRHSPATEFKPGNKPHNTLPVGQERLRSDGYIWVKIAEPNKWREKHVLLWEYIHGPVPPKHVVIFIDQNPANIAPDNLKLVKRSVLLRLNANNYKKTPASIKPAVLALSELEVGIYERIT